MPTFIHSAARAKINLSLRVLRRRPDGYHDLDSLMARLDLADQVGLARADSGGDELRVVNKLQRPLPDDFGGPANLALKALAAFRARRGWPEGPVIISLEKRIPFGAGLGGGSADCAAVLELLNRLAPEPLPPGELAEIGLSLGADVPFCLLGRPLARAEGVGERLSPPSAEAEAWLGRKLLLVNPGLELSTASVFKKLGLTNGAANNNLGPVSEPGPGENDLFKPAVEVAPELSRVVEVLRGCRPEAWGMSGSGSTFWMYEPAESADSLSAAHPRWWIRAARIG